jgi:iron complex transport system ATP-binding protein
MTVKTNHIAIELRNLTIGYHKGNYLLRILENLNAGLHKGELVCLVGENGVGKSTLLRTISGVQQPLSGDVLITGRSLHDISSLELARTISLVLTDRIYAGNLSVRELVALGRYPYTNWLGNLRQEDQKKIEWALEITGTQYLEDQLISELSDGQFQKTLIARALAQDSDMIILDEPTAHLDLVNKIIILKLLKDLASNTGKSILMATHELELSLQIADFIWMAFKKDRMVTGTPEDLIINGSFNKMIHHDAIHFDDLHGRFKIKNTTDKLCSLTGERSVYFLTQNALNRKGWTISNEKSDVSINILKNDKEFIWQVKKDNIEKEAHTIKDMLDILKIKK